MLIKSKFKEDRSGSYSFYRKTYANAHSCLASPIFQELWRGFCCNVGDISINNIHDYSFIIGSINIPKKPEKGYILEIAKDGVSIVASDEQNLIYGFFHY